MSNSSKPSQTAPKSHSPKLQSLKKYLPTLIIGTVLLIAVAAFFIYLDSRPQKTVGDAQGDENLLALKLSDDGSYYTVTGLGNYSGGDIQIPSEFKGVPVKEIGKWAFREKSSVVSVSIPDSVEIIRESAFKGTSITEIDVPDSVKLIEGYVFADCERLERARLPKNVDGLGEHIFESCVNLTETTLPENLTEIPAYTFSHCTLLENIIIPEGVEALGEQAFYDCNSLRHIDLPERLKTVSFGAFWNARLEEIKLPSGLKEIGKNAFMGNPLTEIELPEGLEKIGSRAFLGTDIGSVFISANVTEIGFEAFGGKYYYSDRAGISEIIIDEENPVYYSVNGCIIVRETGELILALSPDGVPDDGSVKIIGKFAYGNTDADVLAVPEGVTLIKSSGITDFKRIGEIILPSTLEKMEYQAISAVNMSSESVKKISFAGTREQWERMERDEDWLYNTDNVLVLERMN